MKERNKLDKTFGHIAFVGIVAFLCTLFTSLYNLVFAKEINCEIKNISIITFFLLLFAFLGFTTTCSIIDYNKKRIKYATKLFGIISVGKWTYLTQNMKLGLKKSSERWGAYSKSNRSISLDYNDLKIVLYDNEDTEIIPVKKIKKANRAEAELEKLSKLLELNII